MNKLEDKFRKYFSEDTGEQERRQLEDALSSDNALREDFILLQEIWTESGALGNFSDYDSQQVWDRLAPGMVGPAEPFSLWSYAAVAASIALFVMSGLYFLNSDESLYAEVATDEFQARITLADGSVVLLHEHSKLRYPKTFDGMEIRQIWLQGNADFNVVSDTTKDFITNNYGAGVLALGTDYLMESDSSDNGYHTTVENVSGSIRLYALANDSIRQDLVNGGDRATFDGTAITFFPAETPKPAPPDTPGVDMTIYSVISELQWKFPRTFIVKPAMDHAPRARVKVDLQQDLLSIMAQLDTTANIDYLITGRRTVRMMHFLPAQIK